MTRIWNERSKAIGGCGAEAVIQILKTHRILAVQGEAAPEYKDHEGVFVEDNLVNRAAKLVLYFHGRTG